MIRRPILIVLTLLLNLAAGLMTAIFIFYQPVPDASLLAAMSQSVHFPRRGTDRCGADRRGADGRVTAELAG